MDYVKAFIVGGIICAIVQIFIDKTKLLPGRIMVGLVVIGSILGAFGLYQPIIDWAGAGASVPLLGFGNTLMKGIKEAVDNCLIDKGRYERYIELFSKLKEQDDKKYK